MGPSPQEISFHALVKAAITHSNNRRKLIVQALKMYFKKLSVTLFFFFFPKVVRFSTQVHILNNDALCICYSYLYKHLDFTFIIDSIILLFF